MVGRKHLRRKHDWVYGITKDFEDLLLKQDTNIIDPSLAVKYDAKEN